MAKRNSKKDLYDNQGGSKQRFEVRLQKLVKAWQKKQEAPLEKRQKLLALWASGYFNKGYSREHMINLVDRGVSTIVPYLVEGNPKIMVETLVGNQRPMAFATQLALNFLIDKMNLAETVLIPAAINSMFGSAIVRTFSEYDRVVNIDDDVIKLGVPAIRVIDDADYIGDCAAKTRQDFVFEGDIYKLPTAYAKDLFSKYADFIEPDCKLVSEYSADKISQGEYDLNRLSLRNYTTFIDVYLYDEGTTITIMPEGKKAKILRTIEEDGPGGTPYDVLGYKYFPGTTYPIPPSWAWHDLDVTMNILARTAKEQAESQKDVFIVDPANIDIGDKAKSAKNLDIVVARNPQELQKISLGGVNPDNYNWMNFAEAEFTKSGVNPDVLGGRGSQSPTLGQEQLVYANASRVINSMYTRWNNFMTSVIHKLAWKVWTDPTVYVPFVHEIPGVGELPIVFSQADKVGDYYDFVFKLVPYSTQRTSPEMQYQKLMSFMAQWVLPTYSFAAQQGAELDIPTITRIMSDYLGFNHLNQWYKTAIPQPLDNVPFTMQPIGGKRPKGADRQNSFNQGNDAFGAMQGSREANMNQQQSRTSTQPPILGA